jgi:hypothetical protein
MGVHYNLRARVGVLVEATATLLQESAMEQEHVLVIGFMLESVPESHVKLLTEGRFIVMPLDEEGVAQAAAMVGVDYLIRDPRTGEQQEILRLT